MKTQGDEQPVAHDSEPRLEDAYIGEWIARSHLKGKFLHASGFGWLKFDGRRWALAAGLVDRLSTTRVMDDAIEMAERLSKRPPLAVSRVLKAVSAGEYEGIMEGLRQEQEGIAAASRSEDSVEGFTAFLEKRDPVFKGR